MPTATTIPVRLNGEPRQVPAGLSVADLLTHLGLEPRLVVVERNGEVLRREAYSFTPVQPDDVLELVHFVGGG